MHLSNTLRVIPINVMCIVSLGFVYTARVQINEELICTIPLNLLLAAWGPKRWKASDGEDPQIPMRRVRERTEEVLVEPSPTRAASRRAMG